MCRIVDILVRPDKSMKRQQIDWISCFYCAFAINAKYITTVYYCLLYGIGEIDMGEREELY